MSPENKTATLCLALSVGNQTNTLTRCLLSVKELIDCWVIIGTGANKDSKIIAEKILAPLPGRYLKTTFTNIIDLKSRLVAESRSLADFMLILEIEEVIKFAVTDFRQHLSGEKLFLEIESVYGSRVHPRVLTTGKNWNFLPNGTINLEGTQPTQCIPISTIRLYDYLDSRQSGPGEIAMAIHEWQDSLDNSAIDLDNLPNSIEMADAYKRNQRLDLAISLYQQIYRQSRDEVAKWYSMYQIALCQEQSNYSSGSVLESLTLAYECLPHRAEPLYHIARICLQQGHRQRAIEINQIAVDTCLSDHRYFFDRSIYEHLIKQQYTALQPNSSSVDPSDKFGEVSTEEHLPINVQSTLAESFDSNANPDAPKQIAHLTKPESTDYPAATPLGKKKKLTIGMATYDDYDGVYFSVQSIRMYHPEVTDDTEIVVIDNNPAGACANALKALENNVSNFRYIPYDEKQSTTVKQQIFNHSNADFVIGIDCHVLIVAGAIKKLLDYFDAHLNSNDLIQGPLIYDDMQSLSTHFDTKWRGGMYGTWATDQRGADPDAATFDIPMQGMGLFACRKAAWPGFNELFSGFGGEEGYIHHKFKQRGGRVLCAPFLRWLHRFGRPMGAPYQNIWEDRIRNYFIGFNELGLELEPVRNHFIEFLNLDVVNQTERNWLAELSRSVASFDQLYFLSSDIHSVKSRNLTNHFRRLGLAHKVYVLNLNSYADPAMNIIDGHIRAIKLAHQHSHTRIYVGTDSLDAFYQHISQPTGNQDSQANRIPNTGLETENIAACDQPDWISIYTSDKFTNNVSLLESLLQPSGRQNTAFSSQSNSTLDDSHHDSWTASESAAIPAVRPASLPAVSCFCPTYGRPGLLEESIECFIRQDYPGPKELVVLNDFDRQSFTIDHPEIRIINCDERYASIGVKRNAAVEYCQHQILLPWDDDDIYLPHRISYSVSAISDSRDYFKPTRAFFSNQPGITSIDTNLFHAQSAWTRTAFESVGGYKDINIGEDTALESAYDKTGITKLSKLTDDELFYIYRWGSTGSYHISGYGGESETNPLEQSELHVSHEIEQGNLPVGNIALKPHWKQNYLLWTASYLANLDQSNSSDTESD